MFINFIVARNEVIKTQKSSISCWYCRFSIYKVVFFFRGPFGLEVGLRRTPLRKYVAS